jgi:hypothetical protein
MESNYAHAFALIQYTHLPGGGSDAIPDFDTAINAVTAADLKRVAETYFTPERSYVIVYDPICTANELAIFAAASTALAVAASVWRYRRNKQRRAAAGEQGWP